MIYLSALGFSLSRKRNRSRNGSKWPPIYFVFTFLLLNVSLLEGQRCGEWWEKLREKDKYICQGRRMWRIFKTKLILPSSKVKNYFKKLNWSHKKMKDHRTFVRIFSQCNKFYLFDSYFPNEKLKSTPLQTKTTLNWDHLTEVNSHPVYECQWSLLDFNWLIGSQIKSKLKNFFPSRECFVSCDNKTRKWDWKKNANKFFAVKTNLIHDQRRKKSNFRVKDDKDREEKSTESTKRKKG